MKMEVAKALCNDLTGNVSRLIDAGNVAAEATAMSASSCVARTAPALALAPTRDNTSGPPPPLTEEGSARWPADGKTRHVRQTAAAYLRDQPSVGRRRRGGKGRRQQASGNGQGEPTTATNRAAIV